MFDADSSGALDAVELTRALEIQEAARTAKQTPGEKLTTAQNNPYTADDTWNCMGAGGRCDSSSDSSSSSSKSKKSAKSTKATEAGSDDAVNCSTHDDCSDLYPDQLDDNWLAVTDDKKPKSSNGAKKASKALAKEQNNPYTADDTWNCMGA